MAFCSAAFISPGSAELLLILLVLILLFGAKEAPRMLRSFQAVLDKIQRAAADFRYQLMYGDLHQTPDRLHGEFEIGDTDSEPQDGRDEHESAEGDDGDGLSPEDPPKQDSAE